MLAILADCANTCSLVWPAVPGGANNAAEPPVALARGIATGLRNRAREADVVDAAEVDGEDGEGVTASRPALDHRRRTRA